MKYLPASRDPPLALSERDPAPESRGAELRVRPGSGGLAVPRLRRLPRMLRTLLGPPAIAIAAALPAIAADCDSNGVDDRQDIEDRMSSYTA
jgi:hypothetical protein